MSEGAASLTTSAKDEGGNGGVEKVAKEKPCTCNGTNENCSRCFGSGYIRDSGLPSINPKLQNWIPESQVEKDPRQYIPSRGPINWGELIGESIVGFLSLLFILYLLWRAVLDIFAK